MYNTFQSNLSMLPFVHDKKKYLKKSKKLFAWFVHNTVSKDTQLTDRLSFNTWFTGFTDRLSFKTWFTGLVQ